MNEVNNITVRGANNITLLLPFGSFFFIPRGKTAYFVNLSFFRKNFVNFHTLGDFWVIFIKENRDVLPDKKGQQRHRFHVSKIFYFFIYYVIIPLIYLKDRKCKKI